jgi:hypothetical protein
MFMNFYGQTPFDASCVEVTMSSPYIGDSRRLTKIEYDCSIGIGTNAIWGYAMNQSMEIHIERF